MNKSDREQFERQLVNVSQKLNEAAHEGKKKTESKTRDEFNNLMRHL